MSVKSNESLTHRQRQALGTQQLILEAARELFVDSGYGTTTIEAIAVRAGVAVSTVYNVFGNKRGILKAIRESWHQESGQRDLYQQASQERNPARRLEMAARATRQQWETGAVMMAIYQGAAAVDPDAAAELHSARAGRRTNLGQTVLGWASGFRSGLEPRHAVAIFHSLTLPEVYLELVREWGWSADEYQSWLAESLKKQLL